MPSMPMMGLQQPDMMGHPGWVQSMGPAFASSPGMGFMPQQQHRQPMSLQQRSREPEPDPLEDLLNSDDDDDKSESSLANQSVGHVFSK